MISWTNNNSNIIENNSYNAFILFIFFTFERQYLSIYLLFFKCKAVLRPNLLCGSGSVT